MLSRCLALGRWAFRLFLGLSCSAAYIAVYPEKKKKDRDQRTRHRLSPVANRRLEEFRKR